MEDNDRIRVSLAYGKTHILRALACPSVAAHRFSQQMCESKVAAHRQVFGLRHSAHCPSLLTSLRVGGSARKMNVPRVLLKTNDSLAS